MLLSSYCRKRNCTIVMRLLMNAKQTSMPPVAEEVKLFCGYLQRKGVIRLSVSWIMCQHVANVECINRETSKIAITDISVKSSSYPGNEETYRKHVAIA
jgi:hypothetical protein